jgi:hypothetical protein
MNTPRSKYLRGLVLACASLAMIGTAEAQGHGFGGGHFAHGGSGFHGGGFRGGRGCCFGGIGLGVGLGVGLGLAGYYGYPWYYPGYVVVDPGVTYIQSQPVPVAPQQSSYGQPVIYPRNGQSAAQMDADSNSCSEWAGKQPNAAADQNVFRRGIAACMDARGYTLR